MPDNANINMKGLMVTMAKNQAKRVDIVSIKMVREASFLYSDRRISCPTDAVQMLNKFLEGADREKFCLLCLNTKNEPTCIATVSIGTLSSTQIHAREVFKTAITSNAAAVLLCHNHPSGDPEPSREDEEVTKRLVEAGQVLGIEVLDHIILGCGDRYISLKERGLLGGGQ